MELDIHLAAVLDRVNNAKRLCATNLEDYHDYLFRSREDIRKRVLWVQLGAVRFLQMQRGIDVVNVWDSFLYGVDQSCARLCW